MQKLDLWLRGVWSFWDTHGTRLLGVISTLYSILAAVVVAVADPGSKISAALLGLGAAFGIVTHARGQTNVVKQPP